MADVGSWGTDPTLLVSVFPHRTHVLSIGCFPFKVPWAAKCSRGQSPCLVMSVTWAHPGLAQGRCMWSRKAGQLSRTANSSPGPSPQGQVTLMAEAP